MPEMIADTFAETADPKDGEWFLAYADDVASTTDGPFPSEMAAIKAAKERFTEEDCGDEDQMVILRIAKRIKLFKHVEVKVP